MPTNPSQTLIDVFGLNGAKGGIAGLVQNFDFSKMDVKDSTRDDYLHSGLAPSYGTLTSESVKAMDEQLKVMIAGTMRTLKALPADQRSWENVLSKMMQNPLLQAEEAGKEVARQIISSIPI